MLQFVVFLIGYTLSQFCRAMLAVIAPELAADLKLDAAMLANIAAAFFIVFALVQFPLGVALDRLGPRRTVPAFMLCGVVGAGLMSVATSGPVCVLANGLIGLGCSPIYMGALYIFARTEAPERFGFLSALMFSLGSMGNLLAAAPLAEATRIAGWRGAMGWLAVVTLVSALLVLVLVKDPPRAGQPSPKPSSSVKELGEILSIRKLWPMIPLTIVCYACVVVERGLWIGPYLAEVFGLDLVGRGRAALAMAAAMSLGALMFGSLDRRPHRRVWLISTAAWLTVAAFLMLALNPTPPLLAAVALLVLAGWVGPGILLLTARARMFFPEHLIGRGITFMNFLIIGGAGFVQWLSGVYVSSLKAAGAPPDVVFSRLHMAFAVTVAVATVIFLAGLRGDGKAASAPEQRERT